MKSRILFLIFLMLFSSQLFAETGKDIFDRFCIVCHSPSMAPMFNSPAAHDVKVWNERKADAFNRVVGNDSSKINLSDAEKDSFAIKELVQSAINGTDKGMPPKGTCSECSDDDLKSVIKFMSSSE